MCSGRVETHQLLKAFEDGVDAVFVAGWEEGNCHFLEGNKKAKARVKRAKKLLEEVGIESERLAMFNLGASDAITFADACNKMTDIARSLGPNPYGKDKVKVIQ